MQHVGFGSCKPLLSTCLVYMSHKTKQNKTIRESENATGYAKSKRLSNASEPEMERLVSNEVMGLFPSEPK